MDARIRYTKFTIEKTFLSLLESTDLSKITVKQICEGAQINRSTFYKYYDNPYDLLKKMEQNQLDLLREKLQSSPITSLQDIFRIILKDILENQNFYKIVFSKRGDKSFRQHVFSFCYSENMKTIQNCFPALSSYQQEWVYYFVAEGCFGILDRWMEEGTPNPIDEVISFVDIIISNINSTLPKCF